MEALHEAAQAATQHINELEEEIKARNEQVKHLDSELHRLEGQIDELQSQLALEKQKADHHLRWATQVTAQIYSIGSFANEAMRIARSEIAAQGKTVPASKTNGEVLKAMENQLSATVADLKQEIPIPTFLKAGPKPHE